MKKAFKLTEKGQKQLDMFKERQVKELLDTIIKMKDYPGLDEIEITANDIEQYSKRCVFLGNVSKRNRFDLLKFCAYFYLLIGMITLLISIFYGDLKDVYERNPEQLSFILAGISVCLVGLVILLYIKSIESRARKQKISDD